MRRAMLRVYTMLAFLIVASGMLVDAFDLPAVKPLFTFPWCANLYGAIIVTAAGIYIIIYGTDG